MSKIRKRFRLQEGFVGLTVLPTFLAEKMSGKNVEKEMSRNPGQEKSWARSSCKPFQKTDSKFITTTPKMGRSAVGAPVVVMNFVLVFCRNFLELLAQLFVWPGFCLDFFLDGFLTSFLLQKTWLGPTFKGDLLLMGPTFNEWSVGF